MRHRRVHDLSGLILAAGLLTLLSPGCRETFPGPAGMAGDSGGTPAGDMSGGVPSGDAGPVTPPTPDMSTDPSTPEDMGTTGPDMRPPVCEPNTSQVCCDGEQATIREITGEKMGIRFARIIPAHSGDAAPAAFALVVGRDDIGQEPVLEITKLDQWGEPLGNKPQTWTAAGDLTGLTGLALTTTETGYGVFYTGHGRGGEDGIAGKLVFQRLSMDLQTVHEPQLLKEYDGQTLRHVDAARHNARFAVTMLRGSGEGTLEMVVSDWQQDTGGSLGLRAYNTQHAVHEESACRDVPRDSEPRVRVTGSVLGVAWAGDDGLVCLASYHWHMSSPTHDSVIDANSLLAVSPQLGLAQVGTGEAMIVTFGAGLSGGVGALVGGKMMANTGNWESLGAWNNGRVRPWAVSAAADASRVFTVWLEGSRMQALTLPQTEDGWSSARSQMPHTLRRATGVFGPGAGTDVAFGGQTAVAIQYGGDATSDVVRVATLDAMGTPMCP